MVSCLQKAKKLDMSKIQSKLDHHDSQVTEADTPTSTTSTQAARVTALETVKDHSWFAAKGNYKTGCLLSSF